MGSEKLIQGAFLRLKGKPVASRHEGIRHIELLYLDRPSPMAATHPPGFALPWNQTPSHLVLFSARPANLLCICVRTAQHGDQKSQTTFIYFSHPYQRTERAK